MSMSVSEPVHHFVFPELIGPKTRDRKNDLDLEIDRYVPVHGQHGAALRFGKAGAQVNKFPALADLPTPWTLAVWIRREAAATASTLLSSDHGGIKIEQWGTQGKLGLTQYGVRDWDSAAVLPLGQWCHLVLVAESQQTRFYLDGQLAATIDTAIALPRKWLGSSGGWTEFLQASIEDLRIYDQALSLPQVTALGHQESPPLAKLTLARENGEPLPADKTLSLGLVPSGRWGTLTLRVSNQGTTPLIFTPTLQDASEQFSLKLPASRVIGPGAVALVAVVFRPKVQGAAQGELVIESNDPRQRSTVLSLGAEGDVPALLPAIKVLLAKTPISQGNRRWLGRVRVGGRKSFPVNICNFGTAPLRFEMAVESVDGRFVFWQGTGPFELEPGAEFCADLAFSPNTTDAAQATINILSNDPDQPSYQFSVDARGEAALPALLIGPAASTSTNPVSHPPVILASAPVGQTTQQNIWLRNAGSGTVTLRGPLTLADTSDAAFTVAQPASLTIPLGGLVTVPITFAPTSNGEKTGKLRVDWDGGVAELQLVAQAMQQ